MRRFPVVLTLLLLHTLLLAPACTPKSDRATDDSPGADADTDPPDFSGDYRFVDSSSVADALALLTGGPWMLSDVSFDPGGDCPHVTEGDDTYDLTVAGDCVNDAGLEVTGTFTSSGDENSWVAECARFGMDGDIASLGGESGAVGTFGCDGHIEEEMSQSGSGPTGRTLLTDVEVSSTPGLLSTSYGMGQGAFPRSDSIASSWRFSSLDDTFGDTGRQWSGTIAVADQGEFSGMGTLNGNTLEVTLEGANTAVVQLGPDVCNVHMWTTDDGLVGYFRVGDTLEDLDACP